MSCWCAIIILEAYQKEGFVRVRIDGSIYDLSERIELEKNKKHNIEVVVDRIIIKEGISERLSQSFETILKLINTTTFIFNISVKFF